MIRPPPRSTRTDTLFPSTTLVRSDAVVIYAPGYMLDRMADSIAAVASEYPRFFAAIDTGRATCRDSLRLAGIAVFDDLGLAVSTLAPLLLWQESRQTHTPKLGRAACRKECFSPSRSRWSPYH